ncbi:BQ2448_5321 [Microbotryum intermedium]|uniref:BQ2448_5321 protein n=1 Tax=Microbotryum intermedium TaxID=269621 RepID=A0A238F0P4_9BASI|nr:BQ2448_5321 [Microbotryum intermedium]
MGSLEAQYQAGASEYSKLQAGQLPPQVHALAYDNSGRAVYTRFADIPAWVPNTTPFSDYSKAVAHRQRLDAQQSESQAVQKEFAALTPDNAVYKLVGPVLLKQDPTEAKANVEKRLQFINSEIERVERNLKELDAKLDKKKMELVHIQTQLKQKQETQQQLLAGSGANVKSKAPVVAV